MKVTVDTKNLAEFVFACVTGFYKANAINLAIRASHEKELVHRTVLEWASSCTSATLENVRRNKKRFLRVTVENIKANLVKGKKQ